MVPRLRGPRALSGGQRGDLRILRFHSVCAELTSWFPKLSLHLTATIISPQEYGGRLFAKMAAIQFSPPPLCRPTLCSVTFQFLYPKVESISLPVESGLACDLLWPVECGGSDSVPAPNLGFKSPSGLLVISYLPPPPPSLRSLLPPCEEDWAC